MPRPLLNILKAIGFGALLFTAITVADYILGKNSDAMAYAERLIRQSALSQQLGEIQSVELAKFWGFRQKTGAAESRTELLLHVHGEERSVELELHLKGNGDNWSVTESSLPL